MKKLYLFVLASVMMLFTACHDKIWDAIDDLDARVAKLEELCKEMNTNISSLQTIVSVLQENDYITGILPIEKGGETIGYTIMFGKHAPITIYNGEDGKDATNSSTGQGGYTPILGVAKDTHGVYYWTLDGEWLLDADGNKVRVTGETGADGEKGKDGVTPKLKIENGYWYVSYDNGATWIELGKAVGEDGEENQPSENGDGMFSNVTFDENNVYFTLTNGTILIVPRGNSSTSDFDQTIIDNLVSSLELNKDTIFLVNVGDKDTIIATTTPFPNSRVFWVSSDETIVKVDNGIVEAVSEGKATIIVKAGALIKECYVFVAKVINTDKEFVDLGLSVNWATCNIGANSPEEYGDYFAWGEIATKDIYTWNTYKYSGDSYISMTKYCTLSSFSKDGYPDNRTILESEDDVAVVNWGAGWRMPTKAEQDELRDKCTWICTKQNDVNGYKVTGPNGNSIFLPAAGRIEDGELSSVGKFGNYWSCTLNGTRPSAACTIHFSSGFLDWQGCERYIGCSIRPVCSKIE